MLVNHKSLKVIHFELSEGCNASCPMCPRTDNGGRLNRNLHGHQISLETIKQAFSIETIKKLDAVHFCGNFGDPILAKDALEIVQYFRHAQPLLQIMFNTNGGVRDTQWWAQLGKEMQVEGSCVVFAIDGLENTNHIYRRGVHWDRLMANVKAFINSGGRARWEFLVFKHNQHEIEESRTIAEQLGFVEFRLKKTSRFYDHKKKQVIPFPVKDNSGEVIDYLYPPEEEYQNTVVRKSLNDSTPIGAESCSKSELDKVRVFSTLRGLATRFIRSKEDFFARASKPQKIADDLNCVHTNEQSIYVSARGEVFPCCFWGGQVRYNDPGPDGLQIQHMAEKSVGSLEKITLQQQSLEQLMNGKWFESIGRSLCANVNSKNRVDVCGRLCKRNSEIVKNEYN
jgi:MoaA/NifB/PqqE/SkfB family radical SAM enzyme